MHTLCISLGHSILGRRVLHNFAHVLFLCTCRPNIQVNQCAWSIKNWFCNPLPGTWGLALAPWFVWMRVVSDSIWAPNGFNITVGRALLTCKAVKIIKLSKLIVKSVQITVCMFCAFRLWRSCYQRLTALTKGLYFDLTMVVYLKPSTIDAVDPLW